MARSIKKGPYVVDSLVKKVEGMNRSADKNVLKTWARRCTILPEFVGHTLAVHNGNKFIPIYVSENMVGHKLGEFVPTRVFRGHGSHVEKAAAVPGPGARTKSDTKNGGHRFSQGHRPLRPDHAAQGELRSC